jgi:hypothetical protein
VGALPSTWRGRSLPCFDMQHCADRRTILCPACFPARPQAAPINNGTSFFDTCSDYERMRWAGLAGWMLGAAALLSPAAAVLSAPGAL